MSGPLVGAVLDRARTTDPRALLVLIALAEYADDLTGEAWPKVPALAKRGRCTRWTITRVLKALEEAGDLVVIRSRGERHRYRLGVHLLHGHAAPGDRTAMPPPGRTATQPLKDQEQGAQLRSTSNRTAPQHRQPHSHAAPATATQPPLNRQRRVADAFVETYGREPGGNMLRYLQKKAGKHGADIVAAAMEQTPLAGDNYLSRLDGSIAAVLYERKSASNGKTATTTANTGQPAPYAPPCWA